jgi:hypothetical protein
VWLAVAVASAQPRPAYWYDVLSGTASPLTEGVEAFVGQALGRLFRAPATISVDPSDLARVLANRDGGDLLFIGGDARTLAGLMSGALARPCPRPGTPEPARDTPCAERLGLEAVNIRLGVRPFYLFAQAQVAERLKSGRGTPVRVAYADRSGLLQPDDVGRLLEPLLRVKSTVLRPLNSPDVMAQLLLGPADTGVQLVGVFDEDPSPLLKDFLARYEDLRPRGEPGQLQALRLLLFPADDADYVPNWPRAAGGGLTYVLARYDDLELGFYRLSNALSGRRTDSVLTLSTRESAEEISDSLLLLSNVRVAGGAGDHERIRRLLSHAYLSALFKADMAAHRCTGGARPIYRSYLLNAHLGDRESIGKALAFWSHLVMTAGADVSPASGGRALRRLQDERTMVEDMLASRLQVEMRPGLPGERLAAMLAHGTPAASTREQFSGHYVTLFRQAVEDIRDGLQQPTAAGRTQRLTRARARLLELIRKGESPACIKGAAEGLFRARDFDPFFYLGLVDAYLTIDTSAGR